MIAKLIALWATYGIKQYIIPAAIGAGAVLLATTHYKAYSFGRDSMAADVAEVIKNENDQLGKNAEDGRAIYRRCVELGRMYDFERGRCY